MKVTLLHSYYLQRGGEDTVFEQEFSQLLSQENIQVSAISVSNKLLQKNILEKISAAIPQKNTLAKTIAQIIVAQQADIVHIHNFWPSLNGIHQHLLEAGLRVVQTLHNFRFLCANGTLFRDGERCELCVTSRRTHALLHRCYKQSFLQTAATLNMQNHLHKLAIEYQDQLAFICLNDHAKSMFLGAGFPETNLYLKPNFSVAPPFAASVSPRLPYSLFIGRNSPEKGLDGLVESWPPDAHDLLIAGCEQPSHAPPKKNTHYLGWLDTSEIKQLLKGAKNLVLPSICDEMCPMAAIDAVVLGTPVITTRQARGAAALLKTIPNCYIENDLNGLIAKAQESPAPATQVNASAFSERRHQQRIIEIYQQLLDRRSNSNLHRPS